VLAVLIVLLAWYTIAKPSQSRPVATPVTSNVGQNGRLQNSQAPYVTVMPSQVGLAAVVRASAVGDNAGVTRAASSGVIVPNGTPVQIIDRDTVENLPARQVRVLSGDYSGQTGWVLANAIVP
jgi:hypothetical protein